MFFKSKKKEESSAVSKEEAAVRENKEKVNSKITIHTMPEKFLSGHDRASQAKKTGLAILAAGAIFLVALVALLYFYFFVSPKINQKNNNSGNVSNIATTSVENNSNKPAENNSNNTVSTNEINNIENIASSSENVIATTTTVENVASSTEVVASSTPETNVVSAKDSDGDGLNNAEEAVIGTNPNLSDSDNDGYSDYQELMNLYNPIGDGALINDPNIKKYTSDKYGYSLLYPAKWQESSLSNNGSVIFKSDDNHIIQVITQPNSDIKTISDWYELQFGSKPDANQMISGDGWKGIMNNSGLVAYITDNNYNFIYTFSYVPEYAENPIYKDIFMMMIKSFTVK